MVFIVRMAGNGTQLDAEFRFADGGTGCLPLLRSRMSPAYLDGALKAATWKSAQSIELSFTNYADASYKIEFYGLRFLDSRGMKDLDGEIATSESVTFRYSLDRIRPPAAKQKSATIKKKVAKRGVK